MSAADYIQRARGEMVRGNHMAASKYFHEAANQYRHQANKEKEPEATINRILSGCAYIEGGFYAEAHNQLSSVERTLSALSIQLPKRWQGIYRHGLKVCISRTYPDWKIKHIRQTEKYAKKKKWKQLLRSVAEYPFAFIESQVAKWRYEAFLAMGDETLAKAFEKDYERLLKSSQ